MRTGPAANERQQYLTIDQLAEWLGLPKSWIYDRTRREAIPVHRLGKHLRFLVPEITDWVESGCPDVSKGGGVL